jgi:hypothetical protein
MTFRPLKRLWQMLEELPQRTTERLDWRLRLAEEWPAAAHFLRRTGRLAHAVACPNPAGDGCPRKVVRHSDGRLVAVCGERPQRCENLDLQQDDIEVLELSLPVLVSDLRRLFGLDEPRTAVATANLVPVGMVPVRAGLRLPLMLGFPSAIVPITPQDLPTLSVGEMAGAVLTPTGRFIDGLPGDWSSLSLAELLAVDERQAIVAHDAATTLIDGLKAKATAKSNETDDVAWELPPDAGWEELVFEFTGPESLNIRFRGETRPFDPQLLGMKRKRTGKPTSQWTALQAFAENDGEMSWSSPGAHSKVKKQKQLLSDKLILAFGIADDPIEWDRRANAYRTKFKISGTPLGFRHAQEARR